jgi:hypothetical protein
VFNAYIYVEGKALQDLLNTSKQQSYNLIQLNSITNSPIPNPNSKKHHPQTPATMHATSLLATILALSAAIVTATPLTPRSANRKANEFSSGDW